MIEVVHLYFSKVLGQKKKKKHKKTLVVFLTRVGRNPGYEIAHFMSSLLIAPQWTIALDFGGRLKVLIPYSYQSWVIIC